MADNDHGRVCFLQCTRCKGIFPEEHMTECVGLEDKWLSDLCPQCVEGWHYFNAFTEDNS